MEILRESTDMSERTIEPGKDTPIPAGGMLGLLALGYRGLEAWREARGRDWIEHRRAEWEAGKAAEAQKKADKAAADAEAGTAGSPSETPRS